MEVKEIRKEYTLVFDGYDLQNLKKICEFYIDKKDDEYLNDYIHLCKEIIEIK